MISGRLWAIWDRFWFTEGSPVPLSVFRILLGLLVVRFCAWIEPESSVFFGNHSVASIATCDSWLPGPKFSILLFLPNIDQWLPFVFTALLIAGLFLTLGVFSRASAFVAYLIMLSLDARDPFALHAGVRIIYTMLFLLSFSRCGAAFSLERLIRVKILRQQSEPIKPGSIVAQRLMQIQMVIIYWSAFSNKLHGVDWLNGTAVYYVTHGPNALRFPVPYLFDHLWTCQLLSWGTLATELSLCTLVWIKEFRYPVLLTGAIFHLGLDWSLVIPLFQSVMLASYVNFLDADDLDGVIRRARQIFPKLIGRVR